VVVVADWGDGQDRQSIIAKLKDGSTFKGQFDLDLQLTICTAHCATNESRRSSAYLEKSET
jgi:hypothetical protein